MNVAGGQGYRLRQLFGWKETTEPQAVMLALISISEMISR